MESHQVTRTVQVGEWNYLVDPTPIGPLQEIASTPHHSSSLIPVTIVSIDPQIKNIDQSIIEETLSIYLNNDDVISKEFFSSLIISLEEGAGQVLHVSTQSKYSESRVHFRTKKDEVLRGPFFLVGRELHKAYRLFPDTYGAFGRFYLIPLSVILN